MSPTRSIASAPPPGRTPIRRWCATSSASSATRRARRCRSSRVACLTAWLRRSAAVPTRSASSIRSSTTRGSRCSGSRPRATGSTSLTATPPRSPAADPACCTATAPISSGLDYPGVGPEHAWLQDGGRVTYLSATDEEALNAFQLCSKLEGIIPALEPAHALAKVIELAPRRPKDHLMVMNLCGRGDKDIFAVAEHLGGM